MINSLSGLTGAGPRACYTLIAGSFSWRGRKGVDKHGMVDEDVEDDRVDVDDAD